MIYRFSSSVKADGPGAAATAVCIPAFRACMLNAAQPRSMSQRISSHLRGHWTGLLRQSLCIICEARRKMGQNRLLYDAVFMRICYNKSNAESDSAWFRCFAAPIHAASYLHTGCYFVP